VEEVYDLILFVFGLGNRVNFLGTTWYHSNDNVSITHFHEHPPSWTLPSLTWNQITN